MILIVLRFLLIILTGFLPGFLIILIGGLRGLIIILIILPGFLMILIIFLPLLITLGGILPQPVPQSLIPQKWRYCFGAPTILMKLPLALQLRVSQVPCLAFWIVPQSLLPTNTLALLILPPQQSALFKIETLVII